jgi:hypothetical protein
VVAARADRVLLLCCWRAGGVCGSGRLMPRRRACSVALRRAPLYSRSLSPADAAVGASADCRFGHPFFRLYSTGLGSRSDISSKRTSGLRTLSVDAQPFGAILLWPTSWGPLAAVKACKSDAYSSTNSSTSIAMSFVTRSGPRATRGSNSYRHNPLPRS